MSRPPHILFAGGVTPSYLYPGLAVAAHVVEKLPEALVTFVGAGRSPARHDVQAAGFSFAHLPSHPAPQRRLHAVPFVTLNVAGYWAARWFLKEQHVSLVVGLGGAASAATVRAAVSRGVPTVLLEQNAVPGSVTRWLARSAASVCAGFAETGRYFPSAVPLVVTGNPARPAFELRYRQPGRQREQSAEKRLIVIGGAEGARSLNESMPAALARLRQQLAGWQVVHQSGEGQLHETACRYREAGVDALVVAWIDEMASVMFESDLVVCRSSGTTLAELALAGVPAVLVPYPPAMEYQMPNAEVFAAGGAATVLDESELTGPLEDALVDELGPLLLDDVLRSNMSAGMQRFARPDAAANITDAICRILCGASARLAA